MTSLPRRHIQYHTDARTHKWPGKLAGLLRLHPAHPHTVHERIRTAYDGGCASIRILGQLNKQTSAHLISGRQSLVSGRRRQSRQNSTRPFVSDLRSRPAHRVSRRFETDVVSIGALQTDRHVDRRKRAFPSVCVLEYRIQVWNPLKHN